MHTAKTDLYVWSVCKILLFTLKEYKQPFTTANILSGNLSGCSPGSAFPLKQTSSPKWISYEVSPLGDSAQFFMDGISLVSYNSQAA